MNIQWNAVTWYSKLLAVAVFLAAFFLAFNLGILSEQTYVETALLQYPVTVDNTASTTDSGAPMVCGGFVRNALTCPAGYHCQLGTIADKGGVCVRDATTTFPIPSGMQTITPQDQGATIKLKKNERFAIEFGTLSWTLTFTPASAITRVANTISTNGYQGVYEANQNTTVTLSAEGRPICKPYEACPQFIQQIRITFIIGS